MIMQVREILLLRRDVDLHVVHEAFRRFERWDVVCWDLDRLILQDITASFGSATLDDETSETTQVHVVSRFERFSDRFHECFNCHLNVLTFDTSFFRDAAHDVRFGHFIFSHLAYALVVNTLKPNIGLGGQK